MYKIIKAIRYYFNLFGSRGVFHAAVKGRIPGFGQEFKASSPTVFVRLGTSDVACFSQVFKEGGYDIPINPAPKVIIDAGANIGMASVYFAERFPDARIIAIEPFPANFEMLVKNVSRFPNITPINAAIWNADGTITSSLGPAGDAWGAQVGSGHEGVQIRSVRMGTLLKEMSIPHVDLLKIDVEGSELEIFDDSERWIESVDMIFAELHDWIKDGCVASFNRATEMFPRKWTHGELTCASRN